MSRTSEVLGQWQYELQSLGPLGDKRPTMILSNLTSPGLLFRTDRLIPLDADVREPQAAVLMYVAERRPPLSVNWWGDPTEGMGDGDALACELSIREAFEAMDVWLPPLRSSSRRVEL